MTDNVLIYDGECPFCAAFVKLVRLREAVGGLRLVNARDGGPEVEAAIAEGYRLNDGMLLRLDGQSYYGDECLNRLALLSSRSTAFNRLNYWLFRSPRLSRISYPVLKRGRALALALLGRRPLTY
ncbi:MAG: DCC1-like thiol-disulfide oxidoreductase family protein [Pseudomonadota bacterium]